MGKLWLLLLLLLLPLLMPPPRLIPAMLSADLAVAVADMTDLDRANNPWPAGGALRRLRRTWLRGTAGSSAWGVLLLLPPPLPLPAGSTT
jgi:hypothetical protein